MREFFLPLSTFSFSFLKTVLYVFGIHKYTLQHHHDEIDVRIILRTQIDDDG
jgi:hypothetical protein